MWTELVRRLAKAYVDGDDCLFALHDALIEFGREDLAAVHFGANPCLPYKCSVIACILSDVNYPGSGWFFDKGVDVCTILNHHIIDNGLRSDLFRQWLEN